MMTSPSNPTPIGWVPDSPLTVAIGTGGAGSPISAAINQYAISIGLNPEALSAAQAAAMQHDLEASQAHHEARIRQKLDRYDLLTVPDVAVKRRLGQPRFRLHYDSLHDISLRLRNTVIYVGADPYYVVEIYEYKTQFWLICEDHQGRRSRVCYQECPQLDTRTPDPQYINYAGFASYLVRAPARQQSQGLNQNNTFIKPAGAPDLQGISDLPAILKGLRRRDIIRWDGTYSDLMVKSGALNTLRLSPLLAFFIRKEDIFAEFKGRAVGVVRDDTVTVDDTDARQPWIKREIESVGCKVRIE